MSFKKFNSASYSVGGRHRSSAVKICGNISSKGSKVLIGYCSASNRKKRRIVSYNKIKAEGLGSFFKTLGRLSAKAGKKIATNALKNPGRFLEIGANVATAAVSRNPEAVLSLLTEVINF